MRRRPIGPTSRSPGSSRTRPAAAPTRSRAPSRRAMADRLGEAMVIDNRSGAGGTIGTAVAARAPADGYTLLLGDTGLTYAPIIYPKAGFNFARDFAPISATRPAALCAGGQSRQARCRHPGSLHRRGEERARRHRYRLDRARHHDSPRDRPVRSARGGAIQPCAVSRRRAHAAGFAGGPDRRRFRRDQRRGQPGEVGQAPGAGRGQPRREPLCPRCRPWSRPVSSISAPPSGSACLRPGERPRPFSTGSTAAVQAALAARKGSSSCGQEQGARVELESRADFARFVAADTERWSRIARAANVQME